MPVVVTGGDTPPGRQVLLALLDAGVPEVRAVVSTTEAQHDLVARGVRTARLAPDDAERLAVVLQGAHTLVHLPVQGGPTQAELAVAVRDGGVRRVVALVPLPGLGAAGVELVVVAGGPGLAERVLAADTRA